MTEDSMVDTPTMRDKLYNDADYRKFVAWRLVRYGLQIAYDEITPEQGMDRAYLFMMKKAPAFKARFMFNAHSCDIYSESLRGFNLLNTYKQEYSGYYHWVPIKYDDNVLPQRVAGHIKRTKAIRCCQVTGMELWSTYSPKEPEEDGGMLKEPYQAFEDEILSIIIP